MKLTIFALVVAAICGCNKPSDDDCRKAIVNMQTLIGTDNQKGNDLEGEVRRCRGGSKKAAVACAIKATTIDELADCAFMKVPHRGQRGLPTTGSAGSAGSATPTAPAPAPTGSAAPAMTTMSAPPTNAGSTASGSGSAGSGSAK